MAIYSIQFQIQSNVPVEELGYQMEVYKVVNGQTIYALQKTAITPLGKGYKTQAHTSSNIDTTQNQHFILSIMIYRKVNGNYEAVFDKPRKKIYSLDNPPILSSKKYRNITYFETQDVTKPENKNQADTHILKITAQERAFEDQAYKKGTPQDPFSKQRIEQQIQNRLAGYNFPNQAFTSLCGAAAFFYCLLKNQPSIYEQVAWDFWNYGSVRIGKLDIKPSKDCRHPKDISKQGVSGLDWMTLASLRDSENIFMDYQVRNPSSTIGFFTEGLAGITPVSTAKGWFEKVGAKCVFDNTMLWTPFGLNHAKLKHLLDLNLYAGKSDYNVIVLIGAGMLRGGEGSSKNHWIVWEDKLTLINGDEITEATPLTEQVKLEAFSWGEVKTNYLKSGFTLSDALDHIFGGFVVNKIC